MQLNLVEKGHSGELVTESMQLRLHQLLTTAGAHHHPFDWVLLLVRARHVTLSRASIAHSHASCRPAVAQQHTCHDGAG